MMTGKTPEGKANKKELKKCSICGQSSPKSSTNCSNCDTPFSSSDTKTETIPNYPEVSVSSTPTEKTEPKSPEATNLKVDNNTETEQQTNEELEQALSRLMESFAKKAREEAIEQQATIKSIPEAKEGPNTLQILIQKASARLSEIEKELVDTTTKAISLNKNLENLKFNFNTTHKWKWLDRIQKKKKIKLLEEDIRRKSEGTNALTVEKAILLQQLETLNNRAAEEETQMRANKIREGRREIEKDRKLHPFKYIVMDKMHPDSYTQIFDSTRDFYMDYAYDFSKEMCDFTIEKRLGKDGKNLTFMEATGFFTERRYDSSNGFILILQNAREVLEKYKTGELKEKNQVTGYTLINPQREIVADNLGYEEGKNLLESEAKKYQEELLAEFAKQQNIITNTDQEKVPRETNVSENEQIVSTPKISVTTEKPKKYLETLDRPFDHLTAGSIIQYYGKWCELKHIPDKSEKKYVLDDKRKPEFAIERRKLNRAYDEGKVTVISLSSTVLYQGKEHKVTGLPSEDYKRYVIGPYKPDAAQLIKMLEGGEAKLAEATSKEPVAEKPKDSAPSVENTDTAATSFNNMFDQMEAEESVTEPTSIVPPNPTPTISETSPVISQEEEIQNLRKVIADAIEEREKIMEKLAKIRATKKEKAVEQDQLLQNLKKNRNY